MKVAKLVMVSLMTRVIVDEGSTDEQILEKAKARFQAKLDNNELMDNLESIEDDEAQFHTVKQMKTVRNVLCATDTIHAQT